MKEIEQVLIVGAGAVGTAIASIIHDAVPGCVSVLADGERFERYDRDGFLVNGKQYRFPVVTPGGPSATEPAGPHGLFDLIIVAVKYHHLPEAIAQMRGHVGPETSILSLLNGISSEEILGAAFGSGPGAAPDTTLPPYAMIIGIDAVRLGNDTRFASAGKINFGEDRNAPGGWSPRAERIARFFDRCGVNYSVPENMIRALWFKFMINVGINQASAVLRAPYSVFQTHPEAMAAMEAPMREVITLSRSMGIGLDESDLRSWEETLSKLHPDNITSMCQDVLAGRKTEVEMFAGAMMELGKKHGIPTPANELYFNIIRTIEGSYQAE